MAMPARRRNQGREALHQFERCEHQADAAARTWFDVFMGQVFGVNFTQSLQREGGAGDVNGG
jgi:hypothetical protein